MGMSLAFHIVFAVIGMAMPLLMVISEGRFLRTKEPGVDVEDLIGGVGSRSSRPFAVTGLSFSSFQGSRATLAGMIVREILSLAEDSKPVGHHYDYQDY
jgi:hypothetical protein